jgi:hypothetical protein
MTTRAAREEAALQVAYKEVFGSPIGKRVLKDILRMFGYWDYQNDTPELRNAAVMILERGGWLHEDNIDAIVDGYVKHQVDDTLVDDGEEETPWRTK